MLTAQGDRWHYSANRFAVWHDALEHRFGKNNVNAGMIGVMLGSFAVAMITFGVFSDMLTSYYGAPLIVSIVAFLTCISIPALGSFQYPSGGLGRFWSASVYTSYPLQLLLSPEIVKDRKALWRFREQIDGFLLTNDTLVDETITSGANPSYRDSVYARRGEMQLEAVKLAEMMGHSGPEFDLHMAEVNRRVYKLEAEEIDNSLARLRVERDDFANSYDKRLDSLGEQIAAYVKLSSMLHR